MKRELRRTTRSLAAIFASLGLATGAMGAGFGITEHSASGLGAAFAGAAAVAEDPSTIFFNPAGMSRLSGTQVSGVISYIRPQTKFKDGGSTINPSLGGTPMPGNRSDHPSVRPLVPATYVSHQLNDDWVIGIGINAPFGLATDYSGKWTGRYAADKSEIKTLNINPSVSYKVTDYLAVGAGVSAQWIEAKLSQKLDSATACLSKLGAFCAVLDPGLATPGNIAVDSESQVKGTDWSLGWNVGFLFDLGENDRLGLSYRSAIKHELDGDAKFRNSAAFSKVAALVPGSFTNTGVKADIRLPASASVSFVHQSGALTLLTDVTWTQWSNVDQLVIKWDSPVQTALTGPSVLPLDWEDTFRLSIGLLYQASERWTLRTGYAYDETPIPNAKLRTPRIPGEDRHWLSLGCGYRLSDQINFDFGYTHLFLKDPTIHHTEPTTGSVINGKFTDTSVDIASVQLTYRF